MHRPTLCAALRLWRPTPLLISATDPLPLPKTIYFLFVKADPLPVQLTRLPLALPLHFLGLPQAPNPLHPRPLLLLL